MTLANYNLENNKRKFYRNTRHLVSHPPPFFSFFKRNNLLSIKKLPSAADTKSIVTLNYM